MSKPWFLDIKQDEAAESLRQSMKSIIGRELNDPGTVVKQAEQEGHVLEKGEGVDSRGASSVGKIQGLVNGVQAVKVS